MINFRSSNLRSNSRLIIIPIFIPRHAIVTGFEPRLKQLPYPRSFQSLHSYARKERIKDSRGFEIWDARRERKPVLYYRRRKFLRARMPDRERDVNRAPNISDHSIIPVTKRNLTKPRLLLSGWKLVAVQMESINLVSFVFKSRHSWNSSRSFLPKRLIQDQLPLIPHSSSQKRRIRPS